MILFIGIVIYVAAVGGECGRFRHSLAVESFGPIELDAVAVDSVVELDAVGFDHLDVDESEGKRQFVRGSRSIVALEVVRVEEIVGHVVAGRDQCPAGRLMRPSSGTGIPSANRSSP